MRTTDEIYSALTQRIARDSGAVVEEGGDMSLRLHAVAAELFSLEAQTDFVARQSLPQTAAGEYLDRHAQVRGLTRGEARRAVGQLRFFVAEARSADLTVPNGTECRTAAGLAFITTEPGVIPAGETGCTVAAEAMETGAAGNVPATAVTVIVLSPTGVEGVCNDAAFLGGSDGEDDEALRTRVLASYRRLPNGANAAYYESRVLSYPGTVAVEVLPKNRGVGTVDVMFAMEEGIPSSAQVAEVAAMLEAEREVSVDLLVQAPSCLTVNITTQLTIDAGYDFETVSDAARAALQRFFSGKMLSKPVYKARLQAVLMGVEGVLNCTISLPSSDFGAVAGRLPVLGTVTINQAV